MSDEERNDPDNLLLLCRKHHKLIDDNETAYPTDAVKRIRSEYISWLAGKLQDAVSWKLKVSAFAYLNVPRLVEYATMQGYRLRTPDLPPRGTLHGLGFELNRVMEDFRRPLESMAINSVSADQIAFAHEGYIGQVISFDRLRFRTKNMPPQLSKEVAGVPFTGDLSTDPHIYHRFDEWTLVFNIDQRWVTTTTAFTLFRPAGGSSVFTGFGRIHSVDLENARMIATALVVGVPRPEFNLFQDGPVVRRVDAVDFESLEDDVTRSRGGLWYGDVPNCDFCGRSFDDQQYMVDGPMKPGGPWGCMCENCYAESRLPLGIGKGQLYRKDQTCWVMVGGYPTPPETDEE